jgi:hypothetical protein
MSAPRTVTATVPATLASDVVDGCRAAVLMACSRGDEVFDYALHARALREVIHHTANTLFGAGAAAAVSDAFERSVSAAEWHDEMHRRRVLAGHVEQLLREVDTGAELAVLPPASAAPPG